MKLEFKVIAILPPYQPEKALDLTMGYTDKRVNSYQLGSIDYLENLDDFIFDSRWLVKK